MYIFVFDVCMIVCMYDVYNDGIVIEYNMVCVMIDVDGFMLINSGFLLLCNCIEGCCNFSYWFDIFVGG